MTFPRSGKSAALFPVMVFDVRRYKFLPKTVPGPRVHDIVRYADHLHVVTGVGPHDLFHKSLWQAQTFALDLLTYSKTDGKPQRRAVWSDEVEFVRRPAGRSSDVGSYWELKALAPRRSPRLRGKA